MLRDKIIDKLTVTKQEQVVNEEELIAKAVAEREAKQAQKQKEEDDTKAAMLKSITAHRELMVNYSITMHFHEYSKEYRVASQFFLLWVLKVYTALFIYFFQRQQKEQNNLVEQQNSLDILQARKEADRIFFEKQQLKSQKKKEGERMLQGHYINQMVMTTEE